MGNCLRRSSRTSGEMEHEEIKCFEVKMTRQETIRQNNNLIPGLPNDVAILCLARVPRSHHYNMRGVCPSWRNLLQERVFTDVRHKLSLTEAWLYLWTENVRDPGKNEWHACDPSSNRWFNLPAMPHDDRIAGHSSYASVDGKVFVIGGSLLSSHLNEGGLYVPSKTVSYFDTRSYCWGKVADMNIARIKCEPGVIDNRLYVFGGYMKGEVLEETTTTAEAYDPITDTWSLISSMKFPMQMYDSVVMGGKFYVVNHVSESSKYLKGLVYDAQTNEWDDMADGLNDGWKTKSVVLNSNGKLYTVKNSMTYLSANDREMHVYNPGEDMWETVDGFWGNSAPMFCTGELQIVSLGGNLCMVAIKEHIATFLVILEMKESSGKHMCILKFSDDISAKIHFTGWERRMPRGIRTCQVVAMCTAVL